MRRRILSLIVSAAMVASLCTAFTPAASAAEAKTPKYQTGTRVMEELNRGLVAVKTSSGVYLSWRVLGKEDLATTAYDIYREGTATPITRIAGGQANNYTDSAGTATSKYKVVVSTATQLQIDAEPWTQAVNTMADANFTYTDIPISMPVDIPHANTTAMSDYKRIEITDKNGKRAGSGGGANDASLGDLDGDGDYEIVLKWDPNDSKDSSHSTTTGHCVFDAYEIDPNNDGYMWRIDIGNNIAAGAHYSQFMVYDFDLDGKAELATITAPGSYSLVKNADGGYDKIYVTTVGDTEEIRNADNSATTLRKGNNNGPEYYTIFDGETGRPLRTTAAISLGKEDGSDWGDAKMNRSERYLAAVAYLDGVNPYYVPVRGMYNRTVLRAYLWDGEDLTLVQEHDGRKKGESMYGEGNHNLSVADIDNDGKDEIVYGSACLDDDFQTVLGNTRLGHGDAMHVSDFNNDGKTEVFSVKEDSEGFSRGIDFRVAETGEAIWSKPVTTDNGRGFMDNVCDEYAKDHPEALALGFSASTADVYDFNGDSVGVKPNTSRPMMNFGVYWDADLSRELFDDNIMGKYTYNASSGKVEFGRIFFAGSNYLPASANNSTKYNPCLVADLWGDWREEIIMAVDDTTAEAPKLRIFTPIAPTQYRLTTLMHDCQYREAIAWQNVGYNQPPHTSYYIGSAALATDATGNTLNYLAPEYAYTNVIYPSDLESTPVTGVNIEEENVTVEKGKTVTVRAVVSPENATKKTVVWESSDPSVATVANGVVKGVSDGTTTITATAKDTTNGIFTDSVTVTVFSNPIKGITISDEVIDLGAGYSKKLSASVIPSDATDSEITWTSADPSIASVSADGTVTGVGFGKTTVTAMAADGVHKAKCIVKVKPIEAADLTGDDVFVSTTNTTDFSGTKTGGSLNLSNATAASEFHKDFTPQNKNKATISMHLNSGGQKEGSTYIWLLGHEYNSGLKFLDTNGNTIIDIYDAHKNASGTGVTTTYKLADDEAKQVSTWTKLPTEGEAPLGRSQIRWHVTVEFDYDNDTATATLAGCTSDWADGESYQLTFPLNGASFKTLQYYTSDIKDYVTAAPSLTDVSYTYETSITGSSESLYERGYITPWSEDDLTDWTQTSTSTASLIYDDENGRIYYNPTKPGAPEYNAVKKIQGIKDDGLLCYDVDWYFGSATGRTSIFEYIQFGSNIRIGWTSGYYTLVSTDAGTTYDGLTDGVVDASKSIFTGANTTYVKHVQAVFDPAKKVLKSLKFDGKEISAYKDYPLPEGATIDSVMFGLQRGGGTSDWGYPNGIENIKVSQFIEGEETPDLSYVSVDKTDGTKASVKYALVKDSDLDIDYANVSLIGALYNKDGTLAEIAVKQLANSELNKELIADLDFTKNIGDYMLKVTMWNSLEDMVPVCSMK